MMRDWRAEVTVSTGQLTAEQLGELTEMLPGFAVVRYDAGNSDARITLTAQAADAWAALRSAQEAITGLSATWGQPIDVIGVRTHLDGADPLRLDLVGYAEIAAMAGVTRQGARHIATEARGFPGAVGKTSNGPVFQREDVARFLETWRAAKDAG